MFSKNAKLYLLCGKEGQLLKTEVNRLKTNAQALVTHRVIIAVNLHSRYINTHPETDTHFEAQ